MQEALVAYTEAQRLDPSTDEALEQAERVRALIASAGVVGAGQQPLAFASTLPEVAEEDEILSAAAAAAAAKAEAEEKEATALAAARAAEEAAKAAAAATAAAENAAALISPAKSAAPVAQDFVPAALVLGREGARDGGLGGVGVGGVRVGGVDKAGWSKAAARDSDSMSVDTRLSNQALLPVGLR